LATKEAQHGTQSEQEPQQQAVWQQVKLWLPQDRPWLLPLIGAGAASLSILLIALLIMASRNVYPPFPHLTIIASLIAFLYGGAAGMLIRRFGILKAVAIPVIPCALLFLLFTWAIFMSGNPAFPIIVAIGVVPPVMCTWLAFWLQSLWARKRRLREAGG
jgi:hypothetical protein